LTNTTDCAPLWLGTEHQGCEQSCYTPHPPALVACLATSQEWLSKYGKPSAKETKLLARLPRLTTLVLGVILKGDFAKVAKALEERLPGVRVEQPPDSDSDDECSSEE